MAMLIQINGDVLESFSLRNFKHAQETVGGLVEVVRLGDRVLLVHEEAIIKNEPLNVTASILARQEIFGEAILLSEAEAARILN
jgi:hypothetical protein